MTTLSLTSYQQAALDALARFARCPVCACASPPATAHAVQVMAR